MLTKRLKASKTPRVLESAILRESHWHCVATNGLFTGSSFVKSQHRRPNSMNHRCYQDVANEYYLLPELDLFATTLAKQVPTPAKVPVKYQNSLLSFVYETFWCYIQKLASQLPLRERSAQNITHVYHIHTLRRSRNIGLFVTIHNVRSFDLFSPEGTWTHVMKSQWPWYFQT